MRVSVGTLYGGWVALGVWVGGCELGVCWLILLPTQPHTPKPRTKNSSLVSDARPRKKPYILYLNLT
ncbi:MAG: hypothetical protein ABJ059_16420, partial [Hyphomicrobiales bacterium]